MREMCSIAGVSENILRESKNFQDIDPLELSVDLAREYVGNPLQVVVRSLVGSRELFRRHLLDHFS
jgi:hypothetical protein